MKVGDNFELLHEIAEKNGFEHYEISNFAKNGNYSNIIQIIGKEIPYIGLGPSAHSYDGFQRRWNVANITTYINNIKNQQNIFEFEELSARDKVNEYIMVSLRTKSGINFDYFKNTFGIERLIYLYEYLTDMNFLVI